MSLRTDELLLAAAAALSDGQDPFTDSFLSEHGVTLDECYELSEHLAMGARLLLNLLRDLEAGGLAATVAMTRLVEAMGP